jgi:hypothetical protein
MILLQPAQPSPKFPRAGPQSGRGQGKGDDGIDGIEMCYNSTRKHSCLDCMSPNAWQVCARGRYTAYPFFSTMTGEAERR